MTDLQLFDYLGWIAALLTLAAMAMKTMMPLRVYAAIASAVFLVGAALSGQLALAALAAGIFFANIYRFIQLRRADQAAREARKGEFSLDWVRNAMRPVKFSDGEVIFRKGDPPHYIYFIKSGSVELEEIGTTLEEGDIFGEIAFFTDAGERTLTAKAKGRCQLLVMRETDFAKVHFQNPAIGLHFLHLVATRLLEGVESNPDAYRPISQLERKRRQL